MGEGRGHPVAGVFIGVYSVSCVVVGGVAAAVFVPAVCSLGGETCERSAWRVAVVVAMLLVFLVGGLWCAWRVGRGHWGLRRRLRMEETSGLWAKVTDHGGQTGSVDGRLLEPPVSAGPAEGPEEAPPLLSFFGPRLRRTPRGIGTASDGPPHPPA